MPPFNAARIRIVATTVHRKRDCMMHVGDWLLLSAAGIVSVPFLVLTVEAFASLLPVRKRQTSLARSRCAVLIPAHDEEVGIADTVRGVQKQLAPGDRMFRRSASVVTTHVRPQWLKRNSAEVSSAHTSSCKAAGRSVMRAVKY